MSRECPGCGSKTCHAGEECLPAEAIAVGLACSERTLTPLRGRVVIREDKKRSGVIIDPGIANEREIKTHRGVVLALGPPVEAFPGVYVDHGFKVGDTVQFHFEGTEKGRIADWDGEPALWMAQREIDAVIE